ncbi:HNH endonuclease family protein [Nocardioides maradonensis]
MHRLSRSVLLVVLGLVLGGLLPAPAHASSYAGNGTLVVLRMRAAINALQVAAETPNGYDRDLFPTWTDQDHDGCDTRAEVLQRSSTVPVTQNQYCTVETGRWYDWYDDTTYLRAFQLDIDHLVPLAEVWASGGKRWTPARREAYANDLADPRTLVPVSLHANRSKGDQEPDEWMPIDHPCRYVRSWVVVKTRWGLAIDRAEKADLLRMATYCGNPTLRTHVATVTS